MDTMELNCLHDRSYPTNLDDAQWEIIAPLIPPGKPVGISRTTPMRAVVNALLYHARSGCSWRMLPRDFPHWRTVYGYHRQWQLDGTWQNIRQALRDSTRRSAEAFVLSGDDDRADTEGISPASCGEICKHAENSRKIFG